MPKLTPEERAAKKSLKKQQLRERKIQLKRDRLTREEHYGTTTIRRHEQQWMKMLVDITLPRMRDELEFAWNNFERGVDCKDCTISLLMDEVNFAEEQYLRNLKCHTQNMDTLFDVFLERLKELRKDYDEQVAIFMNKRKQESDDIDKTKESGEQYLKLMLFGLEKIKYDEDKRIHSVHYVKINEEHNKLQAIINKKRALLEHELELVCTNLFSFFDEYKKTTKYKLKAYQKFKEKEANSEEFKKEQVAKLGEMSKYIKILKMKFEELKVSLGSKVNELSFERRYFADTFTTLKQRLFKDKQRDFQVLASLSTNYNNTLKHLKILEKKGDKLLRLIQSCRRLETMEEKVQPFHIPLRTGLGIKEIPKSNSNDQDLKLLGCMPKLELFFQKIAQANASIHAINEEKYNLELENEGLRKRIEEYCKCTYTLKLPIIDKSSVSINRKTRYGIAYIKKCLDYQKP